MIDRDKASRLGLRAQEIASTVRTAFNGSKVSNFRDGSDEYDIFVQLDENFRSNSRDLESLYIFTPSRQLVPLSEIAEITTGPAFGSIRHVDRERVITVSGNNREIPGPVLLGQVQKSSLTSLCPMELLSNIPVKTRIVRNLRRSWVKHS